MRFARPSLWLRKMLPRSAIFGLLVTTIFGAGSGDLTKKNWSWFARESDWGVDLYVVTHHGPASPIPSVWMRCIRGAVMDNGRERRSPAACRQCMSRRTRGSVQLQTRWRWQGPQCSRPAHRNTER